MSNSDNPQGQALDDLERVLSALTEELASWRRRALRAEAGDVGNEDTPEGVLDKLALLENENSDLKNRVTTARDRVDGLITRLHFLEEQVNGK